MENMENSNFYYNNETTHFAKINMSYFETYELLNIIVAQIKNQLPRGRKNKSYTRIREYMYYNYGIPIQGRHLEEPILELINEMCAGTVRNMFYKCY